VAVRPLEDVRILAVEQYGAGPFGSVHLADLGAEVIKIEDPRHGGDIGRAVGPYVAGDTSLFFETFNRNKRSIALDLSNPAGRAVFEDLVRISDAVYSNLRGDVPERLGIRYADLAGVNERVVCCSLSGFGMTGPRRAQPAYDYILQGMAGWMALTGEPDGPPTKTGPSLVDYTGGLVAAFSLIVGVHAARRDGVGMDCDVSLFETALGLLGYPATWWLTAGHRVGRTRHSAHPSLVPFQAFPTADGWLVVACAKEKFWQRLTVAIDRPELAADQRFGDFAARREHAGELVDILDRVFAERGTATWIELLSAHGVPCGPVNDLPQAMRDEQIEARGAVLQVDTAEFGAVRQLASPLRVGDQRPPTRRAPRRGEDGPALLTGLLGYPAGKVDELARAGAFGAAPEEPGPPPAPAAPPD